MTDTASRHQGTAAARSALTPGLPHLVWIAPTAWDGVIGTDRPMAEQMTRYANVLWVQPQSSVATSARRHGKLRDGIAPALSQIADRLTCLSPVALPGLTRPGVRQTTSPLLRAQIRWALRQPEHPPVGCRLRLPGRRAGPLGRGRQRALLHR